MKLIIMSDKLMDKTKIETMAKALKIKTIHSDDLDAAATHLKKGDKIVIDMNHFQAELVVEKYPKQSYVFGPHTQAQKMKKFRSWGCEHVHPRSVFFKEFKELLT